MNRRVDSPWIGVVLCAGLGTRLRPLTNLIPKPLVPIGDKALAQFAAEQLFHAGASKLELNAFHLASHVEAFARLLSAQLSIDVGCHVETELLGTGGSVAALRLAERPIVVWNGDIFAPDLSLGWVNERTIEVPTLVVSARRAVGAGTLGLNNKGEAVRVRGQQFGTESHGADYIGVVVLPPAFIATLPKQGCLVGDGILPWLASGKRVDTFTFNGYWSDGGTVVDYLAQNRYWLRRSAKAYYLDEQAWCQPGVKLVDTVVGRGAAVLGDGTLARTVVWPGARAMAPLADAVVLSTGEVVFASTEGVP